MRYLITIAAFAGLTLPAAAFAQKDGGEPAKVIDDLIACRAISEPGARLACMDRTSAVIAEAREKKQIVVLDREGVREAKRSVFGFSIPKIKLFGRGDDEPEVTEITDKIANVRDAGNGKYLIRLSAGSIWQTLEARMSFGPKAGESIRIESGLLGSYKAFVGRGRSIPVKRVQ